MNRFLGVAAVFTSVALGISRQGYAAPDRLDVDVCIYADTDGDKVVSRVEWSNAKKGYDWLFPIIDTGGDGHINAKEYAAFQLYKARNPDWRKQKPKSEQ